MGYLQTPVQSSGTPPSRQILHRVLCASSACSKTSLASSAISSLRGWAVCPVVGVAASADKDLGKLRADLDTRLTGPQGEPAGRRGD